MRHRKFSHRLNRTLGHRRAAARNLLISLLKYQRIRTTKAKAKLIQPMLERLISLGKKNTLHSRRWALKILDDKTAVSNLFSHVAPLFKDRISGFSRAIRLSSSRKGDAAEMVFLELTEKSAKEKPKQAKKERPAKQAAPSQKAETTKLKTALEKKPKPSAEKARPAKELKPKKFLGGLRKFFKKERDSL
jgi:large subunit ribosomal protein L17